MNEEEKKLIRTNRLMNMGVSNQAVKKVKYWNDSLAYCREFIQIEEYEYKEFSLGFRKFLITRLRTKAGELMAHFSDERILEFFNVSSSILNELQSRFLEIKLPMSDDFKTAILPSNQIFTSTPEENERLEELEQLIDAIEKIAKRRIHIDYYGISRALSGAVIASGKRLDPNENHVKNRNFYP